MTDTLFELSGISPSSLTESRYLDLCEIKPPILYKIPFKLPYKQNTFRDPWFHEYIQVNNIPYPDYLYSHSDISDVAFQKGIAKYCRDIPRHIHRESYDLAWAWTREIYHPIVANSGLTSLSDVFSSADLTTSPGALLKRYFTDKAEVWSDDGARELILNNLSNAKYMGGTFSLFCAYEKDEIRPNEKVYDNKTRLFMSAPTEHFALSQVLCLDFNRRMIKSGNRFTSPCAIGMNLYGNSFDRIGKSIINKTTQLFGDIGGFDSSIHHEDLANCANMRYLALHPSLRTPETLNMFCNLYRDIMKTPTLLPDGTVAVVDGNPSGQGNTGIDNTIILTQKYCYAWIANGNPPELNLFLKHVYLKCFGDDSVCATSYPGFTAKSVQAHFADLGFQVEYSQSWEFLGHFIVYNENLKRFVPAFPTARAFASGLYSGEYNWYACASKFMALRIDAYTNPTLFKLLDEYCLYLLSTAGSYYDILIKQYLSEDRIQQLFRGSPSVKQSLTPTKNVPFFGSMPETQSVTTTTISKPKRNRNKNKKNRPNGRSSTTTTTKTVVNKPAAKGPRSAPKSSSFRSTQSSGTGDQNLNQRRHDSHSSLQRFSTGSIYDPFINQLMDPMCSEPVRMPNTSNTPVALTRSVREFLVSADASVNGGRWSFAVNPHMGSAQQPASYKVALMKGNYVPATVDFSSIAAYETTLNTTAGGGAGAEIDLRYDPYYSQLLTPNVQAAHYTSGIGALNGPPFPNATIVTATSYGLTLKFINTPLIGNGTRITFPPGQWDVSMSFIFTPAGLALPTVTGGPGVHVQTVATQVGNNNLVTQTFANLDIVVTTPDTTTGGYIDVLTPAGGTVQVANMSAVATFLPELTNLLGAPIVPPMNYGTASQYRPIAMAVLFTCELPALTNGGMIAAARVNGRSMQQSYFTNLTNQTTGSLQMWEQLEQIDGAYSGRLQQGSYAWWMFDDVDDRQLYEPSKALANGYPGIIMSGNWTPSNPSAGTVNIGRVLVTTIYEFTTTNKMFPMKPPTCMETELFEAFLVLLAASPAAMENGEHFDKIMGIMRKVREVGKRGLDWFINNQENIVATLGTVAKGAAIAASFL